MIKYLKGISTSKVGPLTTLSQAWAMKLAWKQSIRNHLSRCTRLNWGKAETQWWEVSLKTQPCKHETDEHCVKSGSDVVWTNIHFLTWCRMQSALALWRTQKWLPNLWANSLSGRQPMMPWRSIWRLLHPWADQKQLHYQMKEPRVNLHGHWEFQLWGAFEVMVGMYLAVYSHHFEHCRQFIIENLNASTLSQQIMKVGCDLHSLSLCGSLLSFLTEPNRMYFSSLHTLISLVWHFLQYMAQVMLFNDPS